MPITRRSILSFDFLGLKIPCPYWNFLFHIVFTPLFPWVSIDTPDRPNFVGIISIIYGSLLWILQSKTSYMFNTFLSSYLDESCRVKPIKKPIPSPISTPNSQTIEMETINTRHYTSPLTIDEQISSGSDS